MNFTVGMCGSGNIPEKLYSCEAHRLFKQLTNGPVNLGSIEPDLRESFTEANAIRIEGRKAILNCTCFVKEDYEVLNSQGEVLGSDLVDRLHPPLRKFDIFETEFDPLDCKKVLFFVVGCVILDWGGLRILDELGISLSTKERKRNNGGYYTLFVTENVPQSKRELYWGSHNEQYGSVRYTTFGDPNSQRTAFPDLFWQVNRVEAEMPVRDVLYTATKQFAQSLGNQILFESDLSSDNRELLTKLLYLKKNSFNIPVLRGEDIRRMQTFTTETTSIVQRWIADKVDEFPGLFSEVTPLRHGVSFREVVIQLWHYIFAHANKKLVHEGVLFDPYSSESDWSGYLPVIFEANCGI